MSILAHDLLRSFNLYPGFLPPLVQGFAVSACDPGAAPRVPAWLAPGYYILPLTGLRTHHRAKFPRRVRVPAGLLSFAP